MKVTLSEDDLYNFVTKTLLHQKEDNKKKSFIDDLNVVLEFHKNIYKGLYKVYGNYSSLEENKESYLNNLFPNNSKVINECRKRFPKIVLNESVEVNYVDNFFDFIRENYVKQIRKNLNEQNTQKLNITPQTKKLAISITKQLMSALGADFDDDEELAVKAIQRINSKECLFEVDRMVRNYKRGKAPYSLKDVINSYMSDYNSAQYRSIWKHLGKFGVTGANYNNFLAGLGKTVEAIGKGWDWLKKNGLNAFMEKFRDLLDSGIGTAVTMFLESFPGLGQLGVAIIWGIHTIWDFINFNSPKFGIGRLFLSLLSLLTAGVMAPVLAPLAKVIRPLKGTFVNVIQKIMASKLGQGFVKWIPKIAAGVTKIGGWLKQGITWLLTKFGKYIPSGLKSAIEGAITKVISWAENLVKNLTKYSTHEASDKVVTQTAEKLISQNIEKFPGLSKLAENPNWGKYLSKVDKPTQKLIDTYIHNNVRKYGWGAVETGICSKYGKNSPACVLTDKIGTAFQLRGSVLKMKEKGSSLLTHNLGGKTKEELASMTPQELKQYRASLGGVTQKVVKDTQKAGKEIGKAIDYAGREISF